MTPKIAVLYKSKHGSTKKYAEWIAHELSADLFDAKKTAVKELASYHTIIFGGFLYAGTISGVNLLTENMDKLGGKRIIVFAVGCAPERKENIRHVFFKNFASNIRDRVALFYLRGAFNFQELNLLDKSLIFVLKTKIKHTKPETLDEDSKGFLEVCEKPADWTNKEAIKPLIEFVAKLS